MSRDDDRLLDRLYAEPGASDAPPSDPEARARLDAWGEVRARAREADAEVELDPDFQRRLRSAVRAEIDAAHSAPRPKSEPLGARLRRWLLGPGLGWASAAAVAAGVVLWVRTGGEDAPRLAPSPVAESPVASSPAAEAAPALDEARAPAPKSSPVERPTAGIERAPGSSLGAASPRLEADASKPASGRLAAPRPRREGTAVDRAERREARPAASAAPEGEAPEGALFATESESADTAAIEDDGSGGALGGRPIARAGDRELRSGAAQAGRGAAPAANASSPATAAPEAMRKKGAARARAPSAEVSNAVQDALRRAAAAEAEGRLRAVPRHFDRAEAVARSDAERRHVWWARAEYALRRGRGEDAARWAQRVLELSEGPRQRAEATALLRRARDVMKTTSESENAATTSDAASD